MNDLHNLTFWQKFGTINYTNFYKEVDNYNIHTPSTI